MDELNNINIAIVGHIDNGKSTLAGQLLHQQGIISTHEIEKYKKGAEEIGKKTFEYAWVMDTLAEERKRGITIAITHREFKTKNRVFTIVDCPGHSAYIKNFITGVSQADAAILLIDAEKGVQEQTKEHIKLVYNARIKTIIVAINKMDLVNYSEEVFNQRKNEVFSILYKYQYKDDQLYAIPISALFNENIVAVSDKMKFYNRCMIDILDTLPLPVLPTDKPFRLQVTDVLNKTGIGVIVTGKVISGKLKVGDKVIIKPGSKTGEVKSIEMHHKAYTEALPGFNVGIVIRGISKDFVRKGSVVSHIQNAPKVITKLRAKISIIHQDAKLRKLADLQIHYGTGTVAAKVTDIFVIYDRTNTVIPDATIVERGNVAEIELTPDRPIVMETVDNSEFLGRFPLRTELGTIAFGICVSITPHPDQLIEK